MYTLLLLNGGIGTRVGANQPKQFLKINGIPMIVYSAVRAEACERINEIVINYPEGWLDETRALIADYGIKTAIKYVPAGVTRHDSVRLMLEAASNDKVLIHEAARPVISEQVFDRLIDCEFENVSYMLEIPFTVAPVDEETQRVTGYLNRATLRNVQLPQKFNKSDLVDAHQCALTSDIFFTEDATLCAHFGKDVFFISGYDDNIKVTTKSDVKMVSHILKTSGDEEL